MQRRDFFITSIRYAVLALLGLLSFAAISGKGEKETCIADNLCNACNRASTCSLPQNTLRS